MLFGLYSRLNRSWESKSDVNVNKLFMFPQKFVVINANIEAISLFLLILVSFRLFFRFVTQSSKGLRWRPRLAQWHVH